MRLVGVIGVGLHNTSTCKEDHQATHNNLCTNNIAYHHTRRNKSTTKIVTRRYDLSDDYLV